MSETASRTSIVLDWTHAAESFPKVRVSCTCGWAAKVPDYGTHFGPVHDPLEEYEVLIHRALCHDGTVTCETSPTPMLRFECTSTWECKHKTWTREWVGWGDMAEATCRRCGEEVSAEIDA